jgi:hypothetical protein
MEMRSFVTVRAVTFKFQYNKGCFAGRQASLAKNRSPGLERWKRLKKRPRGARGLNLHDLLKERIWEKSIRKRLILKDAILAVLDGQRGNVGRIGRKGISALESSSSYGRLPCRSGWLA